MIAKIKLKKGDQVIVLTGRDKGKSGEIIEVLREERRVKVRGVNMVKRHQRQTQTQEAAIIEMEAPLHISNVALRDPKSGKPTRIGYKTLDNGQKVRVARTSGEVIDR